MRKRRHFVADLLSEKGASRSDTSKSGSDFILGIAFLSELPQFVAELEIFLLIAVAHKEAHIGMDLVILQPCPKCRFSMNVRAELVDGSLHPIFGLQRGIEGDAAVFVLLDKPLCIESEPKSLKLDELVVTKPSGAWQKGEPFEILVERGNGKVVGQVRSHILPPKLVDLV